MGREWVGDDGEIQHYDPQWVKQIDSKWHVESFNWRGIYEAMRRAVGVESPGYLWHEAIIWDSGLRRWIVLPRKASQEAYTPLADETRGTNVLLLADENFSTIEQLNIGPLEPDWGFAAVRKVPGTNDTYAALKVLEVGSQTATKICVFDLKGNMLMEPPFLHVKDQKFEGLEFLWLSTSKCTTQQEQPDTVADEKNASLSSLMGQRWLKHVVLPVNMCVCGSAQSKPLIKATVGGSELPWRQSRSRLDPRRRATLSCLTATSNL